MSEGGRSDSEGVALERKMMTRPPNKKRFEEGQESMSHEIKELEEERNKLLAALSDSEFERELKQIQSRKNDVFIKRKQIDGNLQKLSKEFVRQNSEMTKVESTLKYKSEERTNETIRRLEQQLKLQNFQLREERRIVKEIDALKRSKNMLAQYVAMKKEVDAMNVEARKLREQRERYYKDWTVQKQKEEKLKQKRKEDRAKLEEIKTALDELYEKKRVYAAEFRAQCKKYQQQQRKKQEEQNRLRVEQKAQRQEAYQKELAEYEASRVPYQDEMQLCTTLLAYLHRFVSSSEQSVEKNTEQTLDLTKQELDGMYVLKKRTDDELFAGCSKPKCKKNKKDKRRTQLNKPINHSLEIFDQFSRLKIATPSVTAEIPNTIHKLEEAKQHYKQLSEECSLSSSWNLVNFLQNLPHSSTHPSSTEPRPDLCTSEKSTSKTPSEDISSTSADCKQSSADPRVTCCESPGESVNLPVMCTMPFVSQPDSVDGCTYTMATCMNPVETCVDCCGSKTEGSSVGTESAICDDSVPSTPEVQTDGQPPRFLVASSPTLSLDSGTVSLDGGVDGRKRSISPARSENSTLVADEWPPSRSSSVDDTRTECAGGHGACQEGTRPRPIDIPADGRPGANELKTTAGHCTYSLDGSTAEFTQNQDLGS